MKAAENAKKAGFDGVQLHAGGTAILIDQFLRNGSNLRDDDYGGPVENRIRLLREVTEALIGVWGKDRVAVRLSPNGETQGVDDSAPEKLFPAAAAALDDARHRLPRTARARPEGTLRAHRCAQAVAGDPRRLQGPADPEQRLCNVALAEEALANGSADAIAFGRPFIGNPDLVARIRTAPTGRQTTRRPGIRRVPRDISIIPRW